MDRKTAFDMRQKLWCWGGAIETVDRKRQELFKYRAWANDASDTLHAAVVTGMPRGGVAKDMTDVVISIEKRMEIYREMEKKTEEDVRRVLEMKQKMDDMISKLPKGQQDVLYLRYVKKKKFAYIAGYLSMTERNVFGLEERAMKTLHDFGA